jgi:hypothetical protein
MSRLYLIVLAFALLIGSGCQNHGHSSLTLGDQSAGLIIGVKVSPAESNPYYTVILKGFDRATNKPLGYFSGRELRLLNSITDKPDICLEDMCYYYVTTNPGDYIIYMVVTTNSAGSFYAETMSTGTHLFHLDAGKNTYAGDYFIKKDMQTGATPGSSGGYEPALLYRSNAEMANKALNSLKGSNSEMLSPAPLHATFTP